MLSLERWEGNRRVEGWFHLEEISLVWRLGREGLLTSLEDHAETKDHLFCHYNEQITPHLKQYKCVILQFHRVRSLTHFSLG